MRCSSASRLTDEVSLPSAMLTLGEKTVEGLLLRIVRPEARHPGVPRPVEGRKLDLEGLITKTGPLEDINGAFEDMEAGQGHTDGTDPLTFAAGARCVLAFIRWATTKTGTHNAHPMSAYLGLSRQKNTAETRIVDGSMYKCFFMASHPSRPPLNDS